VQCYDPHKLISFAELQSLAKELRSILQEVPQETGPILRWSMEALFPGTFRIPGLTVSRYLLKIITEGKRQTTNTYTTIADSGVFPKFS
jgi:hypothetical protein